MSTFQTIIAIVATISLFLYGLKGFSQELKDIASDHLKTLLAKVTQVSIGGFLLGGVLTAIIQSSSAVSSITVALVDAGVIPFTNSLAVLLGANVGTTSTAWLVTFKIGQIAPFFIVLGTILSMIPWKIHLAGKSVFYFGLILFSLELISQAMEPLKNDQRVFDILAMTDNNFIGIIVGILITALVQSSSVTTGLSIIMAEQGILTTEGAIAIIIGSNLGTTTTALIASAQMNAYAKLAARANFFFNLIGIVLMFPFIHQLGGLVRMMTESTGFQIAFAHLIFNVTISILMLPFIKKFGRWLLKKYHVDGS